MKLKIEAQVKKTLAKIEDLSPLQQKVMTWLSGKWEAIQSRGDVYEINGTAYPGSTFKALEKMGLVEKYVLVPNKDYPTYAYRITKNGKDFISQ